MFAFKKISIKDDKTITVLKEIFNTFRDLHTKDTRQSRYFQDWWIRIKECFNYEIIAFQNNIWKKYENKFDTSLSKRGINLDRYDDKI